MGEKKNVGGYFKCGRLIARDCMWKAECGRLNGGDYSWKIECGRMSVGD